MGLLSLRRPRNPFRRKFSCCFGSPSSFGQALCLDSRHQTLREENLYNVYVRAGDVTPELAPVEPDNQGIGKARTGWTQNLLRLFYMSETGVSTPMLALKFIRSGRTAATALEQKGLTQYGVKFFAGFIQQTGVRRFINKSDGEPAMKALKDAAAKAVEGGREHRTGIAGGRPLGELRHRVGSADAQGDNCGIMGHIARDCRMKGKGKGKGRDEGKEHAKGKGKMANGAGRKGSGKSGGVKGEQKRWGYQGQCWTCGRTGHKSSECRWKVDNVVEDDAESRRSGERCESEKDDEVGRVWIVGMEDEEMICECLEQREVEEGSGCPGCRSKHSAQIREDRSDGFSGIGADRRDGFSKIRADQRDGCGRSSADGRE